MQVKTVAELVHARGSMKWGMRGGTYLEEFIKDTDVEKYRQLYDGATFHPDENEDIVDDIRLGKDKFLILKKCGNNSFVVPSFLVTFHISDFIVNS